MTVRRLLKLVPLVAYLLLSACSDESTDDPPGSTPLSFEAGPAVQGDLRAFDNGKQDVLETIDVLLNNLAVPCMAAKGFALDLRTRQPDAPQLLFGLPEDADPVNGFHIPSVGAPVPPPENGQEGDPDYQMALNGSTTGMVGSISVLLPSGGTIELFRLSGCMGEAREKAFGSEDVYLAGMNTFLVLQDLAMTSLAQAQSSDDYAALNKEWASCMAASGYAFRTPLEAWDSPWPSPVGPEEIAAAQADISCKQSLNYTATAAAVIAASDEVLVEDHTGELEEWAKFLEAVNAAASAAGS